MGKWKFLLPGVKRLQSLVENFKDDFDLARTRRQEVVTVSFDAPNHNQGSPQITAESTNVESTPATNISNPVVAADRPQPIIVHAQESPASITSASSSPPAVDSCPENAGGATLPVPMATATTEQVPVSTDGLIAPKV